LCPKTGWFSSSVPDAVNRLAADKLICRISRVILRSTYFADVFMGLGKNQEQVLAVLRSACHGPLRNESGVLDALASILSESAILAGEDRKLKTDHFIYQLGLLYAHQTGAMPAFTNGESETRFERFVHAVPAPADLRLTRHMVKAAIRRLDAKRNPQFARDLENLDRRTAAE
jgi:hypothetical protein